MNGPSVIDRMTAALADLAWRWRGKRMPKAFYLTASDWAAFEATNPPSGRFPFGNNPTIWRDEPTLQGVPVRISKAPESRLYDHTTTGRPIPRDLNAPPRPKVATEFDVPAEQVFSALDAISRTRALTDRESEALEAAMHGKVTLTRREAIRLRIGQ